MNPYEELKQLIADNTSITEFADFGNGVSSDWISKAEAALGVPLPPSYKWWLSNYSGGEVGGEEVFSIYEQDFDSVVGGDIVYMDRLNQQDGTLNRGQLAICQSDVDGLFFFDTSSPKDDGEYPVISAGIGSEYASDFLDFLKKRIQLFAGN